VKGVYFFWNCKKNMFYKYKMQNDKIGIHTFGINDMVPVTKECIIKKLNVLCYMECNNNTVNQNNTSIKNNMFCGMKKIKEHDFDIYTLEPGTFLFKSMKKIKIPNNDVLNVHSSNPTWYSTLYGASRYILDKNLDGIHQYRILRKIKLLDLNNHNNLKIIIDKLTKIKDDFVSKFFADNKKYYTYDNNITAKDNLVELEKMINNKNEIEEFKTKANTYINQINNIKYATGYDMTIQEQHYKISMNPKNSSMYVLNNDIKSPVLIEISESLFGHTKESLNRVSIYDRDQLLAKTLIEYFNFDGYYGKAVPSLFHEGVFRDEICIFVSRGATEKIDKNTTNITFKDNYDWTVSDYSSKIMNIKNEPSVVELFFDNPNKNCDKYVILGGNYDLLLNNEIKENKINATKIYNNDINKKIHISENHYVSNQDYDNYYNREKNWSFNIFKLLFSDKDDECFKLTNFDNEKKYPENEKKYLENKKKYLNLTNNLYF
jgi:hypothetical protein